MSQRHQGPGLQPERTALAWQRTGAAALALVISTAVLALRAGHPMLALGGAILSTASGGLVLAVRRRFEDLQPFKRSGPSEDLEGSQPARPPFVPMIVVAVMVLLGGLGGAGIGVAVALR